MGVNSLPKTVTRQRRHCDLNPGPSAHANHSAIEPPTYDFLLVFCSHLRSMPIRETVMTCKRLQLAEL